MNWAFRPETNDLGIIKQVFDDNGCYFPEDMHSWWVIDIGAHIGAASALAAIRGASVTAFEPGSSNYQMLLKNILENSLSVTAFHMGLGDGGIHKLYLDKYNTGQNSGSLIYPELQEDEFEYMQTIRLEEIFPEDRACDFLKLDCEGCEDNIIDDIVGGLHTKIKRIFIEFHTDTKTKYVDALMDFYAVSYKNYGYLFTR